MMTQEKALNTFRNIIDKLNGKSYITHGVQFEIIDIQFNKQNNKFPSETANIYITVDGVEQSIYLDLELITNKKEHSHPSNNVFGYKLTSLPSNITTSCITWSESEMEHHTYSIITREIEYLYKESIKNIEHDILEQYGFH